MKMEDKENKKGAGMMMIKERKGNIMTGNPRLGKRKEKVLGKYFFLFFLKHKKII